MLWQVANMGIGPWKTIFIIYFIVDIFNVVLKLPVAYLSSIVFLLRPSGESVKTSKP